MNLLSLAFHAAAITLAATMCIVDGFSGTAPPRISATNGQWRTVDHYRGDGKSFGAFGATQQTTMLTMTATTTEDDEKGNEDEIEASTATIYALRDELVRRRMLAARVQRQAKVESPGDDDDESEESNSSETVASDAVVEPVLESDGENKEIGAVIDEDKESQSDNVEGLEEPGGEEEDNGIENKLVHEEENGGSGETEEDSDESTEEAGVFAVASDDGEEAGEEADTDEMDVDDDSTLTPTEGALEEALDTDKTEEEDEGNDIDAEVKNSEDLETSTESSDGPEKIENEIPNEEEAKGSEISKSPTLPIENDKKEEDTPTPIAAEEPYFATTQSIQTFVEASERSTKSIRTSEEATGKTNDSSQPSGGALEIVESVANAAMEIAKDKNIEAVVSVAGEIAKDLLSILRFGAANLLTASLPQDQREDLLKRMGASTAITTTATEASEISEPEKLDPEVEENTRASIQEEIALARAEEAQENEAKWEKEKDEIILQMEEAANARVENELKIQKQRLEEETARALREKDQAMEAETERLEKVITEERERAEVLVASAQQAESEEDSDIPVENLFAVPTDEEKARNQELEELLEKRQKQQAALESIEEELRVSVASEEEERARLESMLEKRQGQQVELDNVEANLRDQVKKIEAEKALYQQLMLDLKTMKESHQRLEQEVEKEKVQSSGSMGETEKAQEHPVLGPVIADLGYKRIYLVSSGKLGSIPVWNRNRIYRNNRAKAMAKDKAKSMDLGFPGAICLHESPSGKLSIVDGQHRVGMMTVLKGKIKKSLAKESEDDSDWKDYEPIFENVLVEVYPEQEGSGKEMDKFAEDVFLEINKAEPVKLIDMPGVASAADRKVITEAVESLQKSYPNMFSTSQRCRVPNVNIDNLRSVIFGANILKRHKVTTSKKLLEWLLEQNAALGNEFENSTSKQNLVSKKQWNKASSNNFYLGLESSWLYK